MTPLTTSDLYTALEAAGVSTINADRIKEGQECKNEEGVESAILFAWRESKTMEEFKTNIREAIDDLTRVLYEL